ncbi:MAG: ribonuclease P protein component 1 [Candidatus Diapherotrites archaeon]|nr:ribonuclease P protein component 1 [Candidatus Diapherotrites archaeon]
MIKTEHYCISQKNLACHELIGLDVEVLESSDAGRIGLKGRVVDETKNVFVIESGGTEKKVPKKEATFGFSLGNEKAVLEGRALAFRPEDRSKECWRKCT